MFIAGRFYKTVETNYEKNVGVASLPKQIFFNIF